MIVHLRLMRVLVLHCFLGLLCGSSAAAQSVLSCDARTEIVREGLPRLAPYHPGASRVAALKKGPHWRFGPFDRAAFGFESVDMYLRFLGPSEHSFGGDYGPVEIVIRLDAEKPRWFKVVPGGDAGNSDERMLYGIENIGDDRDTVQLATNDPRVPVFVVRLGEDTGRGSVSWQHVIDLRPHHRRVPVAIQCYTLEAQGACGTWDAMYQVDARRPGRSLVVLRRTVCRDSRPGRPADGLRRDRRAARPALLGRAA
jgi:hypothetical protein